MAVVANKYRQAEITMIPPEWPLGDLSTERRELLTAKFGFCDLIEDIVREMRTVRIEKEKGTHEAKGSWRPVFRLDVSATTFDRFFNSPYGYRAQYLVNPENGRDKNASLLAALVDKLVLSLSQDNQIVDQVRRSLLSPHAKVWIEEDRQNPRHLVIEIAVPQWVAAAKEAHKKLMDHDSSITQKEVDRIYGVRAPQGTTLKVMGAWVATNGELKVVASKLRRAEEIRAYGIS